MEIHIYVVIYYFEYKLAFSFNPFVFLFCNLVDFELIGEETCLEQNC